MADEQVQIIPDEYQSEHILFRGTTIICPCLQEITKDDLFRGYHNKCDRLITIQVRRQNP